MSTNNIGLNRKLDRAEYTNERGFSFKNIEGAIPCGSLLYWYII